MGDVELETPDLDLDEGAGRFKRAVALAVVLITLLGAIVAYVQAVESNDEDVAARDAQRDAIRGLGSQVDASTALTADLRIATDVDALLQREALNAGRVEAIGGDADSDLHLAARQRFAAVAEAIADLTPVDPADAGTIGTDIASRSRGPDAARLRQGVEAELANDHGGKADSYVAILTVLAVALFLLGLSLTVQGRNRYILAAPGVAIALVCIGWSLLVAGRDITRVSESAIDDVAEGRRLQDAGDLEGAIARYDEAIEDSPDFAAAFARRASAQFLLGSPQTGQTQFLSITSDEALEAAIDDLDRALELGADADTVTVAEAGFFAFLDGDFERSVQLSSDAIELNSSLAQVWFNLGVAHVALGDEDAAEDAYDEGLDVLEEEPSAGTRSAILAGARTDLSVLREILDGDELDDVIDLIESTEATLADVELASSICPDGETCVADADVGDTDVGDPTFSRSGAFVFASLSLEGVEPGDAVGAVWYFRTDDDLPFEQAGLSFDAQQVLDDRTISTSTLPVLEPACPVVGDYLVRLYAGGELLGEVQGRVGTRGEEDEDDDGAVGGASLGTQFTALNDPVEGFEACIPEGFEVTQEDVSDLDAFTTYGSEEAGFLIGVNVTPGALAEGQDAEQLEELLVSSTVPGAELVDVELQGRDLEGNFVPLQGTAAVGVNEGFAVATVVVAGPDASTRSILITAPEGLEGMDDLDLLLEVVGTVTFTGVGTSSG